MSEITIKFPVQKVSSNCLVPNDLEENYVHSQHTKNKAKTSHLSQNC